MLALIALDAFDGATTFITRELSADALRSGVYLRSNTVYEYTELVPLLRRRGRDDLVQAIETLVDEYRGEIGLTGRVRRFDRVHLNGSIASLWRSTMRRPVSA
jgi:hypothetical protein